MHPYLVEALRFFVVGSNSGWFGLACPAHCSSSWVLVIFIFVAGVGVGALSALFCVYFLAFPRGPLSTTVCATLELYCASAIAPLGVSA